MNTYKNLYSEICSYSNLELAFKKARKRKTLKQYVMEFELDLNQNLLSLQKELAEQSYKPRQMTVFTVHDPKTRKISASNFRDRIVHHAICNILEPICSREYIYDSWANREGKGTHSAIERFESFARKNKGGYILKADIKHYFDNIDHQILINMIQDKIKDEKVMCLVKQILGTQKKGMPLGNLTSQNFANLYLNKLDQFVKHKLRAKYYIRYVDDFVILSKDRDQLEQWRYQIAKFLKQELKLELHADKTKIFALSKGTIFLGFRIFEHYRLLKKSNSRRIFKRIRILRKRMVNGNITALNALLSIDGWRAYASFANTYKLQERVIDIFINKVTR